MSRMGADADDTDAGRRQMGRKHVFAINGSPEFLDIIRELLQGEQYNVTTTNYVPRTFQQIAALRPDLIILDLVARQPVGQELLERLHAEAQTLGIPVLLVSTSQRLIDEVASDVSRYGEHIALLKPLELGPLLDAVGRLIGPA